MAKELNKIINLAQDNVVIILDRQSNETYALLKLDEYQKICCHKQGQKRSRIMARDKKIESLTENELLDNINRDIAVWKNKNREEELRSVDFDFKTFEEEDDFLDDDDLFYYEN